jgi:hypothetical protein
MSDYPRYVTIAILALLIVSSGLGAIIGAAWERLRRVRREDEAWKDGFDVGAACDDKLRKMQARRRVG